MTRTRYRQQRWRPSDTAIVLSAAVLLAAYAAVRQLQPAVLSFLPYPRLHWPGFNPALGAAFLALTVPAFSLRKPPQGLSTRAEENR